MKKMRMVLSVLLATLMIFTSFAFAVSAEEECNHSYSTTSVAPTCVEDGYVLCVCTLCGHNYKNYSDSPKALGHNFGEWYNFEEPSCTKEGHSQRDCSRCGASEVKTVSILEHTDKDTDGACDFCGTEMDVEQVFSPYDWLVALFNAIVQWFRDIFA